MTLEQAKVRISDLEHEVRTLKAALGLGVRFPAIFNFSKREQALLGVLAARRLMTHDMMIMAVYGDCADGGPDTALRTLYVNMVAIRKKLKRFDIKVMSVPCVGYEIDERSQKLLREIMIKDVA